MSEKPCGFQATIKGALKLAGRNALFRRTEQIDRLKPNPHRDMTGLKYGANLDGERLTAGIALVKANPVGLPLQPTDVFLCRATMWTDGAVRPQPSFGELIGSFFAMEMIGGKDGLHVVAYLLDHAEYRDSRWERQVKRCREGDEIDRNGRMLQMRPPAKCRSRRRLSPANGPGCCLKPTALKQQNVRSAPARCSNRASTGPAKTSDVPDSSERTRHQLHGRRAIAIGA